MFGNKEYTVTHPPRAWTGEIEHYVSRAWPMPTNKLERLLTHVFTDLKPLEARACILYWKYLKGV